MQNLRQMLGGVKNKIETTAATEKAKKDNPKPPTFFEKHLPALRSGQIAANYEIAKNLGRTRAKAFIDSIRNPAHPSHERNIRDFFNIYEGDYDKIDRAYVDSASDELAYPSEDEVRYDPAYETRVEKEHQPKAGATHDDLAFFDILKSNLRDSRELRGYGRDRCHDLAVIREWKEKYHRN